MAAVRIQMMGSFALYIDEVRADQQIARSKKGVALLQQLILAGPAGVTNQRLLSTLWSDEKNVNPDNALKTLISRLRSVLNAAAPELGSCIVAERGSYRWYSQPSVTVDLLAIEDILQNMKKVTLPFDEQMTLCSRLLELYTGDLSLAEGLEGNEWAAGRRTELHKQYLEAIYNCVDLLKVQDKHEEIIQITRRALDVDSFDDRLHLELMNALVSSGRDNDAMLQYEHAVHMNYRYLGAEPGNALLEFHQQIIQADSELDNVIGTIRQELAELVSRGGAFVCDYPVFKEIYDLQIRNLERLGSSMFLAVISVTGRSEYMTALKQDSIMRNLVTLMQYNLRKGDMITRYNPTTIAALLPTVNHSTGCMVVERIKRLFFLKHPNSDISFDYRIAPVGSTVRMERDPNRSAT